MFRIRIQNKKKCIWYCSAVVSFLLFLLLLGWTNHLANTQDAQQMAGRWSEKKDVAQISCFFSSKAEVTEDTIQSFEYSLKNVLQEASITETSENPSARLWVDAYSADGKITLVNGKNTLDANAIGIGGDFFMFHPLKLITGAYLYIGNVPHIVTGVVQRPDSRMDKAAGLNSTVVYVSYETLSAYGTNNGINHYEIVMPNPVDEFAYGKVKEGIGIDEKNVEIVENSRRYSLPNRIKTILAFGTRSMNGKAIIYPYWENLARGYEDIIALLTVFMLLLLLYPVVTVIWCFVHWWRHKGWTLKEVWHTGKDKAERAVERRREKKHPHKERDVLEELERELEEDPYADSEFSWLTDEPAEETEPADAASEEPEKAQTMNMQTEETQTPEDTKEEQQS